MFDQIIGTLLDPILGIAISQTLIIWSFCVSHWAGKKTAIYITIFAAIPVTILGFFSNYNRLNKDETDKTKQNLLFKSVESRSIDMLGKISTINSHLDTINSSLSGYQAIQNKFIESSKSTQQSFEALQSANKTITSSLDGLSNSDIPKIRSSLDKLYKATNLIFNELTSSILKEFEKIRQLQLQLLEEERAKTMELEHSVRDIKNGIDSNDMMTQARQNELSDQLRQLKQQQDETTDQQDDIIHQQKRQRGSNLFNLPGLPRLP